MLWYRPAVSHQAHGSRMLITDIVNFSSDNLWLLCDSHSIDSVVEYLGRQTCTCISILNALWNYLPRPLPSTVSWDHSTFHRCVLYTTGVECHLWCCATFHTMPGSISIIWWHNYVDCDMTILSLFRGCVRRLTPAQSGRRQLQNV